MKKAILQVDGEHSWGTDSDGNPLAEIPKEGLEVWIQDKNGNPLDGKHYVRLTISRDGRVKKEIQGQVAADVKSRAVCPRCENDKWIIDRRTLEQGDEPTEASCSECGYLIYV